MSILQHASSGVAPITSRSVTHRCSWHRRSWILPVLLVELVLTGAAVAALGGDRAVLAALIGTMAGVVLVHAAACSPQADGPGLADLVTGLRLGMAIGIGALVLFAELPPAMLAGLLALALATDAFDGWIARSTASASRFGARFDLETDAVLLAAAALAAMEFTGPIVLLAPMLRLAWVLAALALPWLERPLPPSLRRRAFCALPIFLLLAVPWPLAGTVLAAPAGFLATFLLVVSFSIDAAHQWQHRQATSPTA
jgi:phosphatidylglycerophosphate synthase